MTANSSSPLLPERRGWGKLSAISCRHSTSKSALRRASATMRAQSTRLSTPRHHCTFHAITSIAPPPLASGVSANSGAHERLRELRLEQQERDQQGRGRWEVRRRDDLPFDSLVTRREHL